MKTQRTAPTPDTLLALVKSCFPEKTKMGLPKKTTRSGLFFVNREFELYYSEPKLGLLEYHGVLGGGYFATVAQINEFIAEYQD